EGGTATVLTTGMAYDSQPRFAPDGERVVFVSDRDGSENLWTIAIDGSDARQLTRENTKVEFASPAFSHDGSHVIVSRTTWSLGTFELWAYHVDGGKGVQITQANFNGNADRSNRLNSLGAVYGPDGRYLYFARKAGGFAYNLRIPQWQIVRRDLRTGEEDYLTQAQGSAFRPVLSPDGHQLVYATRHEQQTGLRIRDLRSGEDKWLVYPVEHDEQESRFTRDLLPGYAFSPDGAALYFPRDGGIQRLTLATGEIAAIPFTVPVQQGLGPRLYFPYRLGLGPVKARMLMGPALSPDGKHLAFSSFMQLHVYDLETGEVRVLTPEATALEGGKGFHPSWSPDGRELAYVSWSSRGGHVWRIRANGRGQPRQVSTVAGYYSDPAWSPDGERILALRASSYDRLYREFDFGAPIGSDLVWFPRQGGGATLIVPSRGHQTPHFGPETDRIYLYQTATGLTSLRYDGTDRRAHLAVKGAGIYFAEEEVSASDVRLSPDGTHALVLHANQLYLVRLLNPNLSNLQLSLSSANLPLKRLTDVGADFFGWAKGGEQIFWTVGNQLYRRSLASVSFGDKGNGRRAASEVEADGGVGEQDEPDGAPGNGEPEIAEAHEAVESYSVDVYRPRHHPSGTLVLAGGTVLTMEEGAEPLADAVVVIVDDRISAVGPADVVSIPEGAQVIDVSGRFLLPGFVDTHAHFRPLRRILDDQNWAFLANLAYGVTTGLDVQPSTTDIIAYEDLIDAGLMIGPRALSTGPGIFSNNEFRSLEHTEAVLRRYKDHYGVRNLKAYLAGDRKQRQYIVEAARRLKLMPTTEGGLDMKLNMTHVIDGFSGNEHNFPVLTLYEDTVQLVARSEIAYTPTLLVTYGGPWAENYFYTRESPHRDPKLRRFMPGNAIAGRTLRTQWFLEEEFTFPQVAAQARKIIRAGGRVGIGAHGQLQGLGYHWELWALASGGLTNLEALTAATRHGAEMIGVAEDVGTLSVGKLADVLVLTANPLENIRNSNSLALVVKNGELYDAATMDKRWPELEPLPEQWWWSAEPGAASP
ncbi:MAG: amidohydrolase family protein, partial [Pseudomonadota bacterium]